MSLCAPAAALIPQKSTFVLSPSIHYSEDDDVCPNPEHQSESRYERERRRLPKRAKRITDIHQQVLQERQTFFVMVVFPNRLQWAELHAGVSPNLLLGHAGADVLFSQRRYMRFNLFSKPVVTAAPGRRV